MKRVRILLLIITIIPLFGYSQFNPYARQTSVTETYNVSLSSDTLPGALIDCDLEERAYYVKKNDFQRFKEQMKYGIVRSSNSDKDLDVIDNLRFEKGLYYEIAFFSEDVFRNRCTAYKINFEGNDKIEKTFSYHQKVTTGKKAEYSCHFFIKLYTPATSFINVTFPSGEEKTLKPK